MSDARALYSVIQFCQDIERGEGVNVGVVVVCPKAASVVVRMAENVERAKKAFGASTIDAARLQAAFRSLARRLGALEPTEEALHRFIASQGNNLTLLPPRAMVVRPDAVRPAVDDLFAALVGERKKISRARAPKGPDLNTYFRDLFLQNVPLLRDVPIEIPVLGKTMRAPIAYKNGGLNFIKPEGFSNKLQNAVEAAKSIGGDGHMLAKHPDPETKLERKLIVAARFKDPALEERVGDVLEEFGVRMVPERELPTFVDEVRQHAHA